MRTDETLLLQVLKFKQLNTKGHSLGHDLVDRMIEDQPEVKEKMRNICAFISPELFEKIESLGNFLELSKREIVEMALLDFVEKANKIVEEVDPFSGLEGFVASVKPC
jgi:hypothetical protein